MSNAIRRAVVAVLIPAEHLPFLRGWIEHHLKTGWDVFLYDNTGSSGSDRKSSRFHRGDLQRSGTDKRGVRYEDYKGGPTLKEVLHGLPEDRVTVYPWHPRNAKGEIIHGQVEAYTEFIRRHRKDYDWAAFIDADEYLDACGGFGWDEMLRAADSRGYSRVMLEGVSYEHRWASNPVVPKDFDSLRCMGRQFAGNKSVVKLDDVIMVDIHWGWRNQRRGFLSVPSSQFRFRHYNVTDVRILFRPHGDAPQHLVTENMSVEIPSYSPWQVKVAVADMLRKKLDEAPEGLIVDLGAGYSTRVMAEHARHRTVIAIEDQESWRVNAAAYLSSLTNVKLLFRPLGRDKFYELRDDDLGPIALLNVDGPSSMMGDRLQSVRLHKHLVDGAIVLLDDTYHDNVLRLQKWRELPGMEVVYDSGLFAVLVYRNPSTA